MQGTVNLLDSFVIGELWAWMLVFARMGAAVMLLPGIGEVYVPARARLLFALSMAWLLAPVLAPVLPPLPSSPGSLTAMIAAEIVTGLFFGTITKCLLSAAHTMGMVVAFQSSLAAAQFFDMSQGTQGSVFTSFLGILALALIFTTDLHHLILSVIYDSYFLIAAGQFMPLGDGGYFLAQTLSRSFAIGVKMAAPIIVIGLLVYLSAGILGRLMPQMQVFFVLIPMQVVMGVLTLAATLSASMLYYMRYIDDTLLGILDGSAL